MNSSGIIKRGLAATAISALAVAGLPALAGTANAAVGSVAVSGLNAYDIDEFTSPDDITVTIKETDGTPSPVNTEVEYKYVRTNEAGVAQPESAWMPGGKTTDATGVMKLNFTPAGSGSYVLTVRTVTSQIASAPFSFVAGESEIFWADGASASSPINGSDSYSAVLRLTNPAQTPLASRRVDVTYAPVAPGDASFGPQTAPAVRDSATTAHSTTGSDGKFTVSLTDSAAPLPENGKLTATALPALKVADVPAADATDELAVSFAAAPVVTSVTVTQGKVFPGAGPAAPGKPVELNVVVRGQAVADNTPADDPILKDYPVKFAVDKGFLTPDTKGAGLGLTPNDLALKAGENDLGDLFGFYQDLGLDETVDTSDDAAEDAAGIVATIEKDADFNDDGLVTQTVTVTAGTKSATQTINYDSSNYLNLTDVALFKDGGSTKVPGSVDLKLFAGDQFGNLVGGEDATISDDTPVANVVAELGGAKTDYVNDNPSAKATSDQPVTQTITATINANENLVNATGDKAAETTKSVKDSKTLVWRTAGGGGGGGKSSIVAKLTGSNNGGKADRLTVAAPAKADGATVKLFKFVGGKRKLAGTKTLENGRATFKKADKNGSSRTKYIAKVRSTNDTKGARSNKRLVK